jgi:hypothetical protein
MDEVLIAAAPGSGLYYNSNTYLGKADIAQNVYQTQCK